MSGDDPESIRRLRGAGGKSQWGGGHPAAQSVKGNSMDDNGSVMTVIMAIACIILWPSLIFLGACDVSHQDAERLMKQEGVSALILHGYAWFACGKDDSFSLSFDGTKNGQPVKGTICGGWMKQYTVRYE